MSQPAIVGVGYSGFQPSTPHLNFREMVYEAAVRAYEDAGGLDPGSDVDAFISCQEDFWEGISITDEFVPDQLGAVLRPVYTIAGDGLQCLFSAYAMIESGAFDVVVIESHGKPSEILSMRDIVMMSYDPIYIRPLEPENVFVFNALEARAFIDHNRLSREDLGLYVVNSMRRGLRSRRAPHASRKSLEAYLEEDVVVDPFTRLDMAPYSDAAVVVVLASGEVARRFTDTPIKILGVWSSSGTPSIVYDDLREDLMARISSERVFRMAGVRDPRREIDFLELDERFSHVPLMVLKSTGIVDDIREALRDGLGPGGGVVVNPLGGALSEGNVLEAHGLARVVSAYEILRGDSRVPGLSGAEKALVHSRRWPSSRTTTMALLSR